jgi:hypothetical protein
MQTGGAGAATRIARAVRGRRIAHKCLTSSAIMLTVLAACGLDADEPEAAQDEVVSDVEAAGAIVRERHSVHLREHPLRRDGVAIRRRRRRGLPGDRDAAPGSRA